MKRAALMAVLFSISFGSLGIAGSGDFGFGVMVGEPTGLKAKLWLNKKNALDFGLGWGYNRWYNYDYYYTDQRCYNTNFYHDNLNHCLNCRRYYDGYYWRRTNINVNYLYHNFSLIRTRERLPLYYGPGISINTWYGGGWQLGLRGVGGIAWMHRTGKYDLFLELTPVLQVYPGAWLEMYGGMGGRFYF
jgi:hypothetical protein